MTFINKVWLLAAILFVDAITALVGMADLSGKQLQTCFTSLIVIVVVLAPPIMIMREKRFRQAEAGGSEFIYRSKSEWPERTMLQILCLTAGILGSIFLQTMISLFFG